MRKTFLAGAGVGIAGIDDQCAYCRGRVEHRQVLARHHHRRRAKTVLREYARHLRAIVELDDQEVLAVRLAYVCCRDAKGNASDGQQGFGIGGGEIDGHGEIIIREA